MNLLVGIMFCGLFLLQTTIFLGCTNIPLDGSLKASSIYYQDTRTKNIIINSLGWNDFFSLPAKRCQDAHQNAHSEIRQQLKKDILIQIPKKEQFHDEKNNLCVVLLSVELTQDEVNSDLLLTQPQRNSHFYYPKIPKIKFSPPPIYPRVAREQGVEGRVLLRLIISLSGDPINIRIIKTSGYPILDQAALRAVGEWLFYPAEKNGTPIPSEVNIPINFRLSF